MNLNDYSSEDILAMINMRANGSCVEAMRDEFELSNTDLKLAFSEIDARAEKIGGLDKYAATLSVKKSEKRNTSVGLRDSLFDALDGLKTGAIEPNEALAMCKISNAICQTVKLEMEAEKMRRDVPGGDSQGPRPLELGGK